MRLVRFVTAAFHAVALVSLAFTLAPAVAATVPASTPDDICLPTADPCIIDQQYEVQAPGSLDFGDRLVRMVPGGRLLHSVAITCRDLSVEVGTKTVAFDTAEPGNVAGSLDINCSGTVTIDGKILSRGDPGGDVRIFGGLGVTINGRIKVDGSPLGTDGGSVFLDTGGSLITNDVITAQGIGTSYSGGPSGGFIQLSAAADITVNGQLDSSGGSGTAFVGVDAKGQVSLHSPVNVNGGSSVPEANGGCIEVYGKTGVYVTGGGSNQSATSLLSANGRPSLYYGYAYPGYGGSQYIKADSGNIVIGKKVKMAANGGNPGADGSYAGYLSFNSLGGKIVVDGQVVAKGYGKLGYGGDVVVTAYGGFDMGPSGMIDVRAKRGGTLDVSILGSYGGSQLDGNMDVRGINRFGNGEYSYQGIGGTLTFSGGDIVVGGRLLNGADGGSSGISLDGCRLDMLSGGVIDVQQGSPEGGGSISLNMQEHVIANAGSSLLADAQGGGTIDITFGNLDKPPLLEGTTVPNPTLTGSRGAGCPVCGNSEIDAGESCDDGNMVSGDGCRDDCQDESCIAQTLGFPGVPLCDDGDACTLDRCDPTTSQCQNVASCEDGVPCTVDTCVVGACQHTPDDSLCDDGNECTADLCDAVSNCSHVNMSGSGCEDGDLCTVTGACRVGVCVATDVRATGASRLTFRFKDGPTNDRASFKTMLPLAKFTGNPTVSGLAIELRDSSNQTIFSSTIPPGSFVDRGAGRYDFRDPKLTVPGANGVVQVRIKTITSKGVAKTTFKIKKTEIPGADGQFRISVSLLFGTDPAFDECLTARFIPCTPKPGKNRCKN